MKTPEQIAANARERARRQNEKAKENWDIISCRLPKGTKERIQAHGLTVNGTINASVLAYLDDLDGKTGNLPQEEKEPVKKDARTFTDSPEDLQAANEWLHQLQAQIASQKKKDSAAMGEELVKKFNKNNCN